MISFTPLTGDPILINKLSEAGNLTIYIEQQTERIIGTESVEGIEFKDLKTGKPQSLSVSGVFIEIGMVPNSDMVKDLVKLNKAGEVPINSSCETRTFFRR
jgi:alkyl hydroperoxide reductase subunit F